MKVCRTCGVEIFTRDGDNRCIYCEDNFTAKKRQQAKRNRRARDQAMQDLGQYNRGLAVDGTYWE